MPSRPNLSLPEGVRPFFHGVHTRNGLPNNDPWALHAAMKDTPAPIVFGGFGLALPAYKSNGDWLARKIDTIHNVDPAMGMEFSLMSRSSGVVSAFMEDMILGGGYDATLRKLAAYIVTRGKWCLVRPGQESLRGFHLKAYKSAAGIGQVHSHIRSVMMGVAGFPALCRGWILHLNDRVSFDGKRTAEQAMSGLASMDDFDIFGVSIFETENIVGPTGRAFRMLELSKEVGKPLGIWECGPGQGPFNELGSLTPGADESFYRPVFSWAVKNCIALDYVNGTLFDMGGNEPEGRVTVPGAAASLTAYREELEKIAVPPIEPPPREPWPNPPHIDPPARDGERWTVEDDEKLEDWAFAGVTTRSIAVALERSEQAVKDRASDLKLSLAPGD